MSHDPYGAFVDLDPAASSGPGPLSGVTLGVKSNIAVKGLPWTGGMAHLRGNIAGDDAPVVATLRSAGARILGTLNMHEAALGAVTDNPFYGRTHNPHRIGFTPGGSSGGSGAAWRRGSAISRWAPIRWARCAFRRPIAGFTASSRRTGAVDDRGMLFLDARFDTIGPLARDLDMIERAWAVIGIDNGGRSARPLTRLLTLRDLAGVECQPAVLAGYQAALAHSTCRTAKSTCLPTPLRCALPRSPAPGRALIGDLGAHRAQASQELQSILAAVEKIPEDPALLAAARAMLIEALGSDGVLLMPTTPHAAFAHGTRAPLTQADFTGLANIAGLPALALPSGRDASGLPVSVQLMGPAGSEAALIALARRLDLALNAYFPAATTRRTHDADNLPVQPQARRRCRRL